MPSLSLIETEAQRIVERLPETRRRALRAALVDLCETRWQEIRGSEPESSLARALWSVAPPLADLFVDLYAAGEVRLDEIVSRGKSAQGLAMLVFEEIERGNEAGVHIAHEAMMAFEAALPPIDWTERVAALLRGTLEPPLIHPHDTHPPLWKALAVISAHTRRPDLPAVLQVIRQLTVPADQAASRDEDLEVLREAVHQAGIRFLTVEDDHILLEQHGHEHKPVRARQLADMLLEIRHKWLG
jgi:hypothetical protein